MNEEFNQWWDSSYTLQNNQYEPETPVWWAWEAWKAATKVEREACAKVCDDINAEYGGEDVLATWCAKAIRARSNT
jgi:hypothetical protein